MSSNTGIRPDVSDVRNAARSAATGQWMSRLARLGYAIKGVVYLIIGWLAAQLAVGRGGEQYRGFRQQYRLVRRRAPPAGVWDEGAGDRRL